MAHAMKHTKAACGHMFKHYERAYDINGEYIKFGNQNINTIFSNLNYNLVPNRDISQSDFVRQRCSEVRMQNRKDVNVMCSWIVTAPQGLLNDELQRFFSASYNFLLNRYGKENVVSAYVHMDEITPHMHYAFVPVVEDKKRGGYKVSAKETLDRKDLQTFHKDLDTYMTRVFGRNMNILNESTKEGNKNIEELKRGTAAKRIDEANVKARQIIESAKKIVTENLDKMEQDIKSTKAECYEMLQNTQQEIDCVQSAIKQLEYKKKALEDELERLQGEITGTKLKINEITCMQPQKTIMGTIKGITIEEIENLKRTAFVSVRALGGIKNLSEENARLQRQIEGLEKQVPSIMDKIRDIKENARLVEIEKAFNRLPDDIKNQLISPTKTQSKGFGHER